MYCFGFLITDLQSDAYATWHIAVDVARRAEAAYVEAQPVLQGITGQGAQQPRFRTLTANTEGAATRFRDGLWYGGCDVRDVVVFMRQKVLRAMACSRDSVRHHPVFQLDGSNGWRVDASFVGSGD